MPPFFLYISKHEDSVVKRMETQDKDSEDFLDVDRDLKAMFIKLLDEKDKAEDAKEHAHLKMLASLLLKGRFSTFNRRIHKIMGFRFERPENRFPVACGNLRFMKSHGTWLRMASDKKPAFVQVKIEPCVMPEWFRCRA